VHDILLPLTKKSACKQAKHTNCFARAHGCVSEAMGRRGQKGEI